MKTETAEEWSLRTWKARHDADYFPRSEQHADWCVYSEMPDWFDALAVPQASDVVLELGCGYGQWMIPLASRVAEIVGVDIHQEPIAKAGELFRERRITNCRVGVNDGLTIPCASRSFGLVYSISVFQHLPRSIVAGYLAEISRVLRPNGRAALHFRNADNVGPYPTPARDIAANHAGDFSVGWTAAEVLEAIADAGLTAKVHDVGLFLVAIAR